MGDYDPMGLVLYLYICGLVLTGAWCARMNYEAQMDAPQGVAVTLFWPLALVMITIVGMWRFAVRCAVSLHVPSSEESDGK